MIHRNEKHGSKETHAWPGYHVLWYIMLLLEPKYGGLAKNPQHVTLSKCQRNSKPTDNIA